MLVGAAAIDKSGMPTSHANAFQSVATATGCMIASRAVGEYATGLLLENYATKGYHNKAKSCNWGPMAGFVMADPWLTKAKDPVANQRAALQKAKKCGASAVGLWITENRRLDWKNAGGSSRLPIIRETTEL